MNYHRNKHRSSHYAGGEMSGRDEQLLFSALQNDDNELFVRYILDFNYAIINNTLSTGETLLGMAIHMNAIKCTLYLLRCGAEVNLKSKFADIAIQGDMVYPIEVAVAMENVKIIEILLDNGALLNYSGSHIYYDVLKVAVVQEKLALAKRILLLSQLDEIRNNGLMMQNLLGKAILSGNIKMVGLLLDHGASTSQLMQDDLLPLVHAVLRGNLKMAHYLVKRGANVKRVLQSSNCFTYQPLVNGILMTHNPQVVKMLLDVGSNAKYCLKTPQVFERRRIPEGSSLLHLAVYIDSIDIAKILLDRGAQIDVKDVQLNSPLHISVTYKNLKMTEFILSYIKSGKYLKYLNKFVNISYNKYGMNLLNCAIRNEDMWMIKLLLQYDAAPCHVSGYQKSPVLFHALSKSQELFELIFSRTHVKNNLHSKTGESLLHIAVRRYCDLDLFVLLQSLYSSQDSLNKNRETILMLSTDHPSPDILKLIISQRAALNLRNNSKQTALMLSVMRNANAHAVVLMKEGANLYLKDEDKTDVLSMAVARNNYNIVAALVICGAPYNHKFHYNRKENAKIKHKQFCANFPTLTTNVIFNSWLEWYVSNPLNLAHVCRLEARRNLNWLNKGRGISSTCSKLPIPPSIQKYLLFDELEDTLSSLNVL